MSKLSCERETKRKCEKQRRKFEELPSMPNGLGTWNAVVKRLMRNFEK